MIVLVSQYHECLLRLAMKWPKVAAFGGTRLDCPGPAPPSRVLATVSQLGNGLAETPKEASLPKPGLSLFKMSGIHCISDSCSGEPWRAMS